MNWITVTPWGRKRRTRWTEIIRQSRDILFKFTSFASINSSSVGSLDAADAADDDAAPLRPPAPRGAATGSVKLLSWTARPRRDAESSRRERVTTSATLFIRPGLGRFDATIDERGKVERLSTPLFSLLDETLPRSRTERWLAAAPFLLVASREASDSRERSRSIVPRWSPPSGLWRPKLTWNFQLNRNWIILID